MFDCLSGHGGSARLAHTLNLQQALGEKKLKEVAVGLVPGKLNAREEKWPDAGFHPCSFLVWGQFSYTLATLDPFFN